MWSITSPANTYVFPEERNLTAKQRAEKQGNASAKANETLSSVLDLKKRPKVNLSDPTTVGAAASGNASGNGTAEAEPAASGAAAAATILGAAAAHAALLAGAAALLIL